ncbi:DNA cytosine methyltransferase [Deinococcus rubellus]|uniref:DNA (cytosine-5-)-methyltransferase n=1 Tax=Deinococcus rubellus TaxID=1889240 RepID=A0ABY5YCH6_9DEIO|nr:DNA cytosine methyltransferase [Deinococcus rubellus]UWX62749.1 DNA cytosine methyltransferase [Deinococcus rubellus]
MKHSYAPLFPYLAARRNAGLLAEGELVIDNFAGAGGASSGMERALGRPVDHAINHDPVAVGLHRVNHPHSHHSVEDVWQVHPLDITRGQRVALCWFSPTCTHFSKAKGAGLLDRKIRGLAWVALRWAALVKPRVIILENVEEFQTWGPLQDDGRPCPKDRGRTFNSFVNALRYQGYAVEWRELRACDYGTPTIRKRLFLVARRDGLPIIWPAPTHAKPSDPRVKAGLLQPWRTAASCIDWSLDAPSIFTRKKALVPATMKRIARGIERFVLNAPEPFIVTCNHGGEAFRGQDLAEPMKTVTAAYDAHGLVQPVLAPCVTNKQHQAPARSAQEPLSTVTTNHNKNELLTGYLVPRYGENVGQASRAVSVELPSPTVVTTGNGSRLAVASLVKHYGGTYQGAGIAVSGPLDTVTTVDHHALLSGHLATYYSQDGRGDPGQPANEPLRTVPTVDRFAPTLATLMRQFGTSKAADVSAPLGTIVTTGQGKTGVITATCQPALPAEMLARARQVYALLNEYAPQALEQHADHAQQLVLVTVKGELYVLADIGMRMLTPRELAKCQGFSDDYVLERTAEGKPVSKAAQVRAIGNSVCPDLAAALTHANLSVALQEAAD